MSAADQPEDLTSALRLFIQGLSATQKELWRLVDERVKADARFFRGEHQTQQAATLPHH